MYSFILNNDQVVNIRKWHIIIILQLNYVIIYYFIIPANDCNTGA
jgi:hypothetical protein